MAFPKFHGIALAANSWISNAVVENLSADPTPLTGGRIWYNTVSKALKFSSYDGGGAVIVEVVATGANVQAALDAIAALGARVTTIEGSYVNKDGSVAFTGNVDAGSNKIVNVANGTAGSDAVNKSQLDAVVGSLTNAFKYRTTVVGGADAGSALNLETLSNKATGDYYKVATAGYFKVGPAGTPFFANVGDGLVFNDTAGVDVIDNTNSTVAGTGSFIEVTGSPDTGYTVDIDDAFKGRVSDLESGLAAETSRAESAESGLATDITDEANRATTAEGVLTGAIADEVARATAAEGTLTTNLGNEVTRATAAEGVLSGKIGDLSTLSTTDKDSLVEAINEIAAGGSAADGKIGDLTTLTTTDKSTVVAAINEVDANADAAAAAAAAEASRAQGVEGSLASLTTTVKTSLVAAINEVDADIAAETTRAQGAESGLGSAIDAVSANVTAVETAVNTRIDDEIARATGVEGTLASLTTTVKTSLVAAINEVDADLATEVGRATAAEDGLSTAISNEAARAAGVEGVLADLDTTDKSNLVAAINEVAAAAGEGTGALKDAINAQRFRFTAATAALSHVVTHNLNSAYATIQVLVKGDDNVFRNDIVAVEETNSNSVTVTLTEARIIKVVVQALDDLA